MYFGESAEFIALQEANKERVDMNKLILKAIKKFALENSCSDVAFSTAHIGGEMSKFLNGTGKTALYAISSKSNNTAAMLANSGYGYYNTVSGMKSEQETVDKFAKAVKENKAELEKMIEEAINNKVSVSIEHGKLGVVNLVVELK